MSHLLLTKAVNTILRHQKTQLDKMFNFRLPTKWQCHLTTLIHTLLLQIIYYSLYLKFMQRTLCFVW